MKVGDAIRLNQNEIQLELDEVLDDEIAMLGRFRADVSGGLVILHRPDDDRNRRLVALLAGSGPGVVEVRIASRAPASQ